MFVVRRLFDAYHLISNRLAWEYLRRQSCEVVRPKGLLSLPSDRS